MTILLSLHILKIDIYLNSAIKDEDTGIKL